MQDIKDTVLDWLTGSFDVFGVTIQNWMVVIGGGLLLYVALLNLTRRPTGIGGSRQGQ
jgi:hypothetical protein